MPVEQDRATVVPESVPLPGLVPIAIVTVFVPVAVLLVRFGSCELVLTVAVLTMVASNGFMAAVAAHSLALGAGLLAARTEAEFTALLARGAKR